jgi:hypothetical protein
MFLYCPFGSAISTLKVNCLPSIIAWQTRVLGVGPGISATPVFFLKASAILFPFWLKIRVEDFLFVTGHNAERYKFAEHMVRMQEVAIKTSMPFSAISSRLIGA